MWPDYERFECRHGIGVVGSFILGIGERVFDPGLLHDICAHVSVLSHIDDFSRGLIDSRRLVYDGSVAALSLFLTRRIIDSWRWG